MNLMEYKELADFISYLETFDKNEKVVFHGYYLMQQLFKQTDLQRGVNITISNTQIHVDSIIVKDHDFMKLKTVGKILATISRQSKISNILKDA